MEIRFWHNSTTWLINGNFSTHLFSSKMFRVSSGVHRGGYLSLLLFNLFTNTVFLNISFNCTLMTLNFSIAILPARAAESREKWFFYIIIWPCVHARRRNPCMCEKNRYDWIKKTKSEFCVNLVAPIRPSMFTSISEVLIAKLSCFIFHYISLL